MYSMRTFFSCSILILSLMKNVESALSKSVSLYLYTSVLADTTRSYNMANQENDRFLSDLQRTGQYAQCRTMPWNMTATVIGPLPPLPPDMAFMDYNMSYQMLNRLCNCANTSVSGQFLQTAFKLQASYANAAKLYNQYPPLPTFPGLLMDIYRYATQSFAAYQNAFINLNLTCTTC